MVTYMYKVLSVNKETGMMEVEYTADGYTPIIVGTPLPTTDTPLTSVIEAYAPISQWNTSLKPSVVDVEVGASGILTHSDLPVGPLVAPTQPPEPAVPVVTPAPTPVTPQPTTNVLTESGDVLFERSIAKVLIKFGLLTSDPTATVAPTPQ